MGTPRRATDPSRRRLWRPPRAMSTPAPSNSEPSPGVRPAIQGSRNAGGPAVVGAGDAAAGAMPQSLSLALIWYAVRKYWHVSAAVGATVVLVLAFYTMGQTKIYRSNATVEVDPSAPKPLGKDVQTVVDMGAGDY